MRSGYEFNLPLQIYKGDNNLESSNTVESSFFSCKSENIKIETVKLAEGL